MKRKIKLWNGIINRPNLQVCWGPPNLCVAFNKNKSQGPRLQRTTYRPWNNPLLEAQIIMCHFLQWSPNGRIFYSISYTALIWWMPLLDRTPSSLQHTDYVFDYCSSVSSQSSTKQFFTKLMLLLLLVLQLEILHLHREGFCFRYSIIVQLFSKKYRNFEERFHLSITFTLCTIITIIYWPSFHSNRSESQNQDRHLRLHK